MGASLFLDREYDRSLVRRKIEMSFRGSRHSWRDPEIRGMQRLHDSRVRGNNGRRQITIAYRFSAS